MRAFFHPTGHDHDAESAPDCSARLVEPPARERGPGAPAFRDRRLRITLIPAAGRNADKHPQGCFFVARRFADRCETALPIHHFRSTEPNTQGERAMHQTAETEP